MHATLGPTRLHTKSDPTNKTARITPGVPQSAPSSPAYFNIYIHELAQGAEKRIGTNQRWTEAALLVADNVLLQASTREALQDLMDAESWWKGISNAACSVPT